MDAATDPRCTCGQRDHLQTCRIELERQQLAVRLAQAAMARMEERAAGRRKWSDGGVALRWYFKKLRTRSTPRSARIEPGARVTRDPAFGERQDEAFAAVAAAIGAAERDPGVAAGAHPVGRWLAEHYVVGRSYSFIAESAGVSQQLVLARMARLHRLVRERLHQRGWLDE